MSLVEAVDSLKEFLSSHLPADTSVEVTREALDSMVGTANNLVAMATEQGVDTTAPRQAYESVGWLSVELEAWAFASPYHDDVFSQWAAALGVN